jgi:ribosomal protein S18 acetylase RimI-like enzyme
LLIPLVDPIVDPLVDPFVVPFVVPFAGAFPGADAAGCAGDADVAGACAVDAGAGALAGAGVLAGAGGCCALKWPAPNATIPAAIAKGMAARRIQSPDCRLCSTDGSTRAQVYGIGPRSAPKVHSDMAAPIIAEKTRAVESRDPGCGAEDPGHTAGSKLGSDSRQNAPEPNSDREAPCSEGIRSGDVQITELTAATPEPLLLAARELLLEYGRFVIAQPGAARFCFGSLQQEADGLPESFLRQGGGSLLALAGGEPAGFVAWRAIPSPSAAHIVAPDSAIPESPLPESPLREFWELKRLWVRPSARGLALGRRLTQAVLDRAFAAGRTAVYLDTAPQSMASAHRLYLDMGFTPCAPYNDNPVEGLVWMVKFL